MPRWLAKWRVTWCGAAGRARMQQLDTVPSPHFTLAGLTMATEKNGGIHTCAKRQHYWKASDHQEEAVISSGWGFFLVSSAHLRVCMRRADTCRLHERTQSN